MTRRHSGTLHDLRRVRRTSYGFARWLGDLIRCFGYGTGLESDSELKIEALFGVNLVLANIS